MNIEKNCFSLLNLLEYLLAFMLILNCSSVYVQRVDGGFTNYSLVAIIILGVLILTFSRKIKVRYLYIALLVLAMGLVYLFATYKSSSLKLYIYNILLFLPLVIIYTGMQYEKKAMYSIYNKFSALVVVLAVVSFTMWFFTDVIQLISPNMSIEINWGSSHRIEGVMGIYFHTQRESTFGLSIYRNSSIFCEGPIYALVLEIALLYELFLSEKSNKMNVFILCINLASTITSSGFIFLILIFLLKYWNDLYSLGTNYKLLFTFTCILFLLPMAIFVIYNILIVKSSTDSYMTRIVDYIAGFQAWKEAPIFGNGYNTLSGIYRFKTQLIEAAGGSVVTKGFSNSTLAILAQGGIWLMIIYFMPFVLLLSSALKNKDRNMAIWAVMVLYLSMITIFHTTLIMMLLVSVAWCYVLYNGFSKKGLY